MTNMCIPSRSEIRVCIRKGGTVLSEVAIERAGEALEGDAEGAVQAVEHGHRQRHLRQMRLRAGAHPRRVPPQHAPHPRQELLELFVVQAAVPVKALLKQSHNISHNK